MPDLTPRTLGQSVAAGFTKTKERLKGRLKLLREYTGQLYGGQTDGDQRAKPLNLIWQAVTTLVPNLVFRNPNISVTSNFLPYRMYAQILGLAANHLVREINLSRSLRMAVTASLFSEGWIKTGLGVSGQTVDIDGFTHNLGQPYADFVDSEDMVIDPTARSLEEAYYIGNRVRVSKYFLLESGVIKPEIIEKLPTRYDYSRSKLEVEQLSHVPESKRYVEGSDDLVEYVDLVECWVPSKNAIVTIPYDPESGATEFLRIVQYAGPETGPYHMLGYALVPNNPLPVAPCSMWYDLHEMNNTIARKIKRQAERSKSVLAYQSSAWETASAIQESGDGETVAVDDLEKVQEIKFGGANDDAYDFAAWSKQMFSEMAMSIDLLSGSGTNEETLGQAEMVQGNIAVRLSDMQSQVYAFVSEVVKDLVFFLHTDPLIQLPLVKRVQGQDQQVFYTPEMREGDMLDYSIEVVPYSMAHRDPNLKARRLLEFFGSVIPALAQTYQLLGPAFNLENAIRIMAREMNVDDLEEVINSADLQMMQEQIRLMVEAGAPPAEAMKMMMPMAVQQAAMQPAGEGPGGAGPGGGRPQQPNPRGRQAAGVGPKQERRQRSQERGAESQHHNRVGAVA